MSNQCSICGQFSIQSSEKTVKMRGMDRRDESRKVEFDVSDVFAGECCGSEILEDPESYRMTPTYQRYLNETPEGGVTFVLLVETEPVTVDIQPRDSSGRFVDTNPSQSQVVESRYVPVADYDLPGRVREWLIGKFGEIETGATL